jgi:uncharacterized protein
VERRAARGPFATRRGLLELPELSAAAFEQAAGFLRVRGGEHPLDATAVHPERYAGLEALAARHARAVGELLGAGAALVREAQELDRELGPLTRVDLATALEQAGRDPRPAFVPVAVRADVRAIENLKPGMVCPGLVTNVTSFGVFVDVGARQDGLVHVSQLAPAQGKDPKLPLQPGDRVEVRVLKVDLEKKQVSLSMKPRPERRAPVARKPRPMPEPRPAAERRPPTDRRPRPSAEKHPDPPRAPSPRAEPAVRERRPTPASAERSSSARPPAARKSEPRRPAFNNPFAVLAGLKKNDKG